MIEALTVSSDSSVWATCRFTSPQAALVRSALVTNKRLGAGQVPSGFAPDVVALPVAFATAFDTTQNDLQNPAFGPDRIRANIAGVLQTRGDPSNGLALTLQDMISFNYQARVESKVRRLLDPMEINGLTVSVTRVNFSAVLIRVGFVYDGNEYSETQQVKV